MQPILARRLSIGAVVIISLVACWIAREFPGGKSVVAVDYRVFWDAANSDHPYDLGAYSIPYPPTALVWLRPLASLEFWTGYYLWAGLSLIAFALAGLRLFPFPVMALTMISPIVVRCAMLGQTPLLLTAALFLGFSAGPIGTGAAVGLVASIKPQIVFFAPLIFLARREWRVIGVAALTFVLAVIIELFVFGPNYWLDWIAALPQFRQTLIEDKVFLACISLGGRAEGYGLPFLPIFAVTMLLIAWLAYRLAPRFEGAELLGLVVASSAIAAPYSLPHDVVALVPIAAAIILGRARLESIPAITLFTWASPLFSTLASIGLALRALTSKDELGAQIKAPEVAANSTTPAA